ESAFVDRAGTALCLICNDKISSMKRSNIKQHFHTRRATFASKYPAGDNRRKACQELLCRVQASQQQLHVWTRQGGWNSACFAGSLAIVRNGKPFTDDMPLSAKAVHDHTIMMANQVEETQVKDINPYFSLALDESTDVSHLSQFSVIAKYAASDTLREESLAGLPMKGSTRGEELLKSFIEFAKKKNLPMDKLISECTDVLLRQHENRPILSLHCLLQQKALCAQMSDDKPALNDRQFKTLLDEVGNNYPGLLLHSNTQPVLRLARAKIQTFLEIKDVKHPELTNTEWLLKFYYLMDMTEHLNQLNMEMQGIRNAVLSLGQAVFAFENKLELFIMDIETGRLLHFEKVREFKDASGFTSKLLQSFKAHFGEFREHTRLFKFITHPHKCAVHNADLSYIPGVSIRDSELEIADLKASDKWVNKFKSLNEDLERLARQQAELVSKHKWTKKLQPTDHIAVLTMFGSTYTCEQSFSLNACMKLNLTTYQPDYKLIKMDLTLCSLQCLP
uniref:DUF4371 domain-containing protein n=1 Tax=Acanthochromis polyacanthus TaxID=80966 RepID=A0A3Q1F2M3_9TELE